LNLQTTNQKTRQKKQAKPVKKAQVNKHHNKKGAARPHNLQVNPKVLAAADDMKVIVDEKVLEAGEQFMPEETFAIDTLKDGSVVQTVTASEQEGDKVVTTTKTWTWKHYAAAVAGVLGISTAAALILINQNPEAANDAYNYASQGVQNAREGLQGLGQSLSNRWNGTSAANAADIVATMGSEDVAQDVASEVAEESIASNNVDNNTDAGNIPVEEESLFYDENDGDNAAVRFGAQGGGKYIAQGALAGLGAAAATKVVKNPALITEAAANARKAAANFDRSAVALTQDANYTSRLVNEAHGPIGQRAARQREIYETGFDDLKSDLFRSADKRLSPKEHARLQNAVNQAEDKMNSLNRQAATAKLEQIESNMNNAAARTRYRGAQGENAALINEANYASSSPQVQARIDARLRAQTDLINAKEAATQRTAFSSGRSNMASQRATIEPADIQAISDGRTANQRMRDAYAPLSPSEPLSARQKAELLAGTTLPTVGVGAGAAGMYAYNN